MKVYSGSNMTKKVIGLIVLFGLLIPVLGQNIDEMTEQIDLKLRKRQKLSQYS